MATQAEKAAALKKLWVSSSTINKVIEQSNLQKAGKSVDTTELVSQAKKEVEAYKSSGGLDKKNTNADAYWDVSGVSQNVWAKDYSSYQKQELWELSKFWESARQMEASSSGSISKRNDIIAWNLYSDKKTSEADIRSYLSSQAGFSEASKEDQENTVRAISERLKQIQWSAGEISWEDIDTGIDTTQKGEISWKAWFYNTKDWEQKIYGYDELDEETKNLLDRMDDSQKKYVSNLWAQWMQEQAKYYLDSMRNKEQAKARQDINEDLYGIQRESSIIQAKQTIRNAQQSYDNLKQNWQYLGNLWMPWVSSTKMDAIWDAISEANTTLWEIERLTQLSLDAQEKQWEGQVLQYNQQIDNLMYDLKWKLWDEVVGALSKYTTAELEWKLDTIDWITAFRKELLDELDNNLSGLTSASLSQMQYINQQYQDVANRMYEYAQNKNKVNSEMSAIQWYYVDGNGNAILNAQGMPIEVPQSAPMEPIFDKETGKLITFAMGEDGQIVASVQQVYQGDATATQSTIVSLLENGVSVQDILKYIPNADLDTVQKLASIVKTIGGGYDKYQWGWPSYTAVSDNEIAVALNQMATSGTWGWCWAYVNQYLQKMGFSPSFVKDSLQSKLDIRNSTEPKVWSVVVFDYWHITPETWENNWHVGIVRGFRDWKMIVQDSNFNWDRQIKLREVSLDNPAIQGYFDPTIWVDEFNKGVQEEAYREQWLNKQGFNDTRAGYYDKYLAAKFTTEDWKQIGDKDKFEEEVENYKKFQESQVADVTVNMLRALYGLKDMGWLDYQNASLWIPRTDWYMKRRDLQNFLSNTTLNKLIESKKSGATFGALSDAELGILQNAASILDWWLTRGDFNAEVNRLIEEMEQWLRDNGRSDLIAEISTWTGKREKVSWGNK